MVKQYLALIAFSGVLAACSGPSVPTESVGTRDLLNQKIKCVEMAERYVKNTALEISKPSIWGVHYSDERNTCLARVFILQLDSGQKIAGDSEKVVDTIRYKTLAAVGRTRTADFRMTTYQAFVHDEASASLDEDLEAKAVKVRAEMKRLMGDE